LLSKRDFGSGGWDRTNDQLINSKLVANVVRGRDWRRSFV